jgi:hypothetical protein
MNRDLDACRTWQSALEHNAELCAGALREARKLVGAAIFDPALSRWLARATDILDQIDEILIGLVPERDREPFVRVAGLHRELEEIQSLVPRSWRWLQRAGRRVHAVRQ